MALVPLIVRCEKDQPVGRSKNLASVSYIVDSSRILAVPSVCKKNGTSDGLVNSKVILDVSGNGNQKHLWCTQTVVEIAALS